MAIVSEATLGRYNPYYKDMMRGISPPPVCDLNKQTYEMLDALVYAARGFNAPMFNSYKASIRESQLRTVKEFLNDMSASFKRKMFIRSLWAKDDLERASDWVGIFRNV